MGGSVPARAVLPQAAPASKPFPQQVEDFHNVVASALEVGTPKDKRIPPCVWVLTPAIIVICCSDRHDMCNFIVSVHPEADDMMSQASRFSAANCSRTTSLKAVVRDSVVAR